MPVPSVVSSRYADQGGAAVVLAMLVLALVTTVAAFLMADYGNQLEFATGRHDLAQSRWLARGAVDWARNVLADDARTSATDHFGENWAIRVAPTAVEDGTVSGTLVELSGRFNLNGLLVAGLPDTAQVAAYKRLLVMMGISQSAADSLTATLLDWMDADDLASPGGAEADSYVARGLAYRPANGPLVDVDELTLVLGYDAALVARLRPFVTALPEPAPLNVNTAAAEVLSAAIPGLGLETARILVARRQSLPFRDLADFTMRLPKPAREAGGTNLAVTSRYFMAVGSAKYGLALTRMEVLLDRKTVWPSIIWQKLL